MACPLCACTLQHSGSEWICSKCGKVGTDEDGVPCFNDPNYYWGEIGREEMELANRIARETGWREAVEATVKSPDVRNYITDPHRADFQYIWDLPHNSRVLDIGAGWGAIASGLGEAFEHVVAVEGVLQRARFIDVRVKQLALNSVHVICADFLRLPLAPEQFDAVVLNGVLEWIGLATDKGDPRDVQLQFLRRVHSLLKPSGFVCLGIENRVGWAAFLGGVDHSGLPYTSLMPRRFAAAWCNWKGRGYRSNVNRGYRTYTYSLPGYRKLLQEAGFTSMTPYHAWNGYNHPGVLLPLNDKAALRHFVGTLGLRSSAKSRIKNVVMQAAIRSGLWAQMASEYIFMVRKG